MLQSSRSCRIYDVQCARLLGKEGLLLLLPKSLGHSLVKSGRVVGWSDGELGLDLLDLTLGLVFHWVGIDRVRGIGAGGLALCLSNKLLGLSGVLVSGALGGLSSTASVLSGKVADLGGLLVYDIVSIGELTVDEFLVGSIDKRDEENGGCRDKTHAPGWSDLLQEVEH